MADVITSLHRRRDVYKALPASTHRDVRGRPLCSWRLILRPYVEQMSWDYDPDASWLVPANLSGLTDRYGQFFRLDERQDESVPVETKLVALTGPETAFPDSAFEFSAHLPTDLILLIELSDSELAWSQPGDLDVRNVPPSVTQGIEGQGVHVGFADGSVWYLDSSVPMETLRHFFTITGAEAREREKELLPFRKQ